MDAPLQARRDDDHCGGPRSRTRSPPRHHNRHNRRDHPKDDRHHHDYHQPHHHRRHESRGGRYDNRRRNDWDDRLHPNGCHCNGSPPHPHPRGHPQRDNRHHERRAAAASTKKIYPEYYVKQQPTDENLPNHLQADPRGEDPSQRITQKANSRGAGRNTESFDPASTLVRPDVRVQVGSGRVETYNKVLKHDDVVIVPELFGAEDDWQLYYKLVEEMTELQKSETKGSEWMSWHEGAHLIVKKPEGSENFQKVIDRLCVYFNIRKESIGYRFNWYKDSSDWKPFHHDSAAFNPQRAKNQNITVGVSFGAMRELAFIRAVEDEQHKVRMYFPQPNNGVFSFGRDVNILWKHGINALKPDEQDGKGRISIILWGLAQDAVEEAGSPPLLGSDGHGPHASQRQHEHKGDRRRRR